MSESFGSGPMMMVMCESETLSVPDKAAARIREGSRETGSKAVPHRSNWLVIFLATFLAHFLLGPFLASLFSVNHESSRCRPQSLLRECFLTAVRKG